MEEQKHKQTNRQSDKQIIRQTHTHHANKQIRHKTTTDNKQQTSRQTNRKTDNKNKKVKEKGRRKQEKK